MCDIVRYSWPISSLLLLKSSFTHMDYYHLTPDIDVEVNDDDDPNWLIIPSLSETNMVQESPAPPEPAVRLRNKKKASSNSRHTQSRFSRWLWPSNEEPSSSSSKEDSVTQRINEIFQSLTEESRSERRTRRQLNTVSGYFSDWAKWMSHSETSKKLYLLLESLLISI